MHPAQNQRNVRTDGAKVKSVLAKDGVLGFAEIRIPELE